MAVIAALKLEDEAPTGRCTSHSDRTHRRFRAGADEAEPLDCRHRLAHQFSQPDFAQGRGAEGPSRLRGEVDRGNHGRIGVAQDERPERTDVVEVRPSGRIPDGGAKTSDDDRRFAPNRTVGPDRAVDTARKERLGAQSERVGPAFGLDHRADFSACQRAASRARYVTITSAPARAIAVSISKAAARRSSQPRSAAASSIANSPETW